MDMFDAVWGLWRSVGASVRCFGGFLRFRKAVSVNVKEMLWDS